MPAPRSTPGPRVVWRVLRAEGVRAVLERAWDQLLEALRTRSFRPVHDAPPGLGSPVLHLSATPPAPRLGGVQTLLLRRLAAKAGRRTVALIYPLTSLAGPDSLLPAAPPPGAGAGAGAPDPGARQAGASPLAGAASQAGAPPGPPPAVARFRLELSQGRRRRVLQLPRRGPRGSKLSAEAPGATSSAPETGCEEAVRQAAALAGARILHIEGLAGLPLAPLLALQRSGLRLVLSLHDFGAFCLRPHLLERGKEPEAFCGYSRDPARCLRCLHREWPEVGPDFQAGRRELARQLLAAAEAVVYPSEFLRRTHLELFPGLAASRHHVIAPDQGLDPGGPAWRPPRQSRAQTRPAPGPSHPHPAREGARPRLPRLRPPRGEELENTCDSGAARTRLLHLRPPLHVAFAGSVQPHKGALVFEEVVRLLTSEPAVRWSVYGGGDAAILARLRRLPRVRVRGYYRAGSLGGLLRRDRVDLALLLSIVPESFGLTLGECAAAGVPAAAFAHGALADRVPVHGGLLLPLAGGATAVAGLIEELAGGRRALPIASLPPREGPDRGEAASWDCLYSAIASRLS